jgi:hypothetical protein
MRGPQAFGIVALLALGAPGLHAQDTTATRPVVAAPVQRYIPVLGISVGAAAIETGAASRAQVGDRSWGLQFDGGVLVKRFLYLGADIGGQFLKDHAQFTQNTTLGEKRSTANVTYFSAIAGLRTGAMPVVPVALHLNVGYSGTMTRRSIDQCIDCDVDKMEIPAGGFVEPVLMLGRQRARLRVSDRVYFAGDGMRNMISIGVDYEARKR